MSLLLLRDSKSILHCIFFSLKYNTFQQNCNFISLRYILERILTVKYTDRICVKFIFVVPHCDVNSHSYSITHLKSKEWEYVRIDRTNAFELGMPLQKLAKSFRLGNLKYGANGCATYICAPGAFISYTYTVQKHLSLRFLLLQLCTFLSRRDIPDSTIKDWFQWTSWFENKFWNCSSEYSELFIISYYKFE